MKVSFNQSLEQMLSELPNTIMNITIGLQMTMTMTPLSLNVDDSKPSHHSDALGRHQIIFFLYVVSDATPWSAWGHIKKTFP